MNTQGPDRKSAENEKAGGGSDTEENATIYHHTIRRQLLTNTAASVAATYDHEPSCGSNIFDRTAVHEAQLSWGEDIKYRPAELLMFYSPTTHKTSEKVIRHLKYDGKLVVDFRGEPLRDFSSLPLVISSKVEGWRIEAWMRSDSRIKMTDIMARMPVEVTTGRTGHQTLAPIYESGTLRERTRKFRDRTGLIPWHGLRDQSIEAFKNALRSPTEIACNQATGRDLTDMEKASLASLNVGTRPNRAQNRPNPIGHQKYLDGIKKKADLTFDFDCRTELPETIEEEHQIQLALKRTYDDFNLYANMPPKMPNTRESYLDQWNFLQVQMNKVWTTDGTKSKEAPQLFALAKWTVSFDNWVSAPQAYLTYAQI